MLKKGFITLEWLIEILKGFLEVVLVIVIVVGAVAIVWNATKKTPMDQDFKRVLDASAKLIEDFQDERIYGNAVIPVPIASGEAFQVYFYPATGAAVKPPAKCKGRTCLCMYYIIEGQQKETCKTIETKDKCKRDTCGEDLCAGNFAQFIVKKGDVVNVAVMCTDQGSVFTVAKT
jgi:hypothetical protein